MGFFDKLFSSGGAEPEKEEATEQPASPAQAVAAIPPEILAFDQDRDEPQFDGVEILTAAEMSAETQGLVRRAKDLLKSLPAGTPREVEAQIVEAAFKAFDVPLDDILTAAKQQIRIFETFIADGLAHYEEQKAESEKRIADLEAEIRRVRADLAWAAEEQEELQAAAEGEIAAVQPVLEFFRHRAERAKSQPPPPKKDETKQDEAKAPPPGPVPSAAKKEEPKKEEPKKEESKKDFKGKPNKGKR